MTSVLVSRRQFLAALAAVSVLPPRALAQSAALNDFPDVPLYAQDFENWSKELRAPALLTCAPRSAQDVADIANWAAAYGWRVRPLGCMHGWSPLSITGDTTADSPVVMLDTKVNLAAIALAESALPAVRTGAGATLEAVMTFLEGEGLGFGSSPAPGDITVGGMLAINAHGAAAPAAGETGTPARVFGSMSNRVLSLEVVAWSEALKKYVVRRYARRDAEMSALLVSLGRAFITEATLACEPNPNLRCVSRVDIPAAEMFGPAGSYGRTLASFVDQTGRVEAIWYPFTDKPWLKAWSVAPVKPLTSREVSQPYNYPFSDQIPDTLAELARACVTGQPQSAPLVGATAYSVSAAGLAGTAAFDLWGASKNVLLFIRPTTLRAHDSGFVVNTSRKYLQQVVHDFTSKYSELLAQYQAAGRYPINVALEIRVNGMDAARDVGAQAQRAALSSLAPRASQPAWDTTIWLSVLALTGTPDMFAFCRELERWCVSRFSGTWAGFRPEWSKGWAYTDTAGWADREALAGYIPAAFDAWKGAMKTLRALDPQGIYGTGFSDELAG